MVEKSFHERMILNAIGLIYIYPDVSEEILKELIISLNKIIYKERIISFIFGLFFGVVLCLFISLL